MEGFTAAFSVEGTIQDLKQQGYTTIRWGGAKEPARGHLWIKEARVYEGPDRAFFPYAIVELHRNDRFDSFVVREFPNEAELARWVNTVGVKLQKRKDAFP